MTLTLTSYFEGDKYVELHHDDLSGTSRKVRQW